MLESGLVELDGAAAARTSIPPRSPASSSATSASASGIGVVAEWLDAAPGDRGLGLRPPSRLRRPTCRSPAACVDPERGLDLDAHGRGCCASAASASPPTRRPLLLLGIYEDTGSLTYATTGPRDIDAAAWLLEQGGDLGAGAALRRPPARPGAHRGAPPHDAASSRCTASAATASASSSSTSASYVDELAPLVSRCLELFDLPLLFALFGEGDRVTRRSRAASCPGFDLGAGAGRARRRRRARHGRVGAPQRARPLEVRERLLAFLRRALPPAARAARPHDRALRRPSPAGPPVAAAKERAQRARASTPRRWWTPRAGSSAPSPASSSTPPSSTGSASGRSSAVMAPRARMGRRPTRRPRRWRERMARPPPALRAGGGSGERAARWGWSPACSVLRHLHGRLEDFEEATRPPLRAAARAPRAGRASSWRSALPPALRRPHRDDRRGLARGSASPPTSSAASCATSCSAARTATSTWWWRATASASPRALAAELGGARAGARAPS